MELAKAQDLAGIYKGHIVNRSPKFTSGPGEDGYYEFEFLLEFLVDDVSLEELEDAIDHSDYGGPGRPYSRTYVLLEWIGNGKKIFKVISRGGYDI